MRLALAAALCLLAGAAHATGPTNCSGTAGAGAAAVAFPTSGGGPSRPSAFVIVQNPSTGTANIGVAPLGTAAIGSAGTYTLYPGGSIRWSVADGDPLPAALSIIASTGSTPYTCSYW